MPSVSDSAEDTRGTRRLTPPNQDAAELDRDPARLRQVLANLLGNAVRHANPGGSVTVSVTP